MKELVYEIIAEVIEPHGRSHQSHVDMVVSHFEDSIRETRIYNSDTTLKVKSLTLIEDDKQSVRIERGSQSDLLLESLAGPSPRPNYLLRVKQRIRNKAYNPKGDFFQGRLRRTR